MDALRGYWVLDGVPPIGRYAKGRRSAYGILDGFAYWVMDALKGYRLEAKNRRKVNFLRFFVASVRKI